METPTVMASDAYFPFPDGIEVAARAGVSAIIQPGGSVRDEMMIETANRHRMAMVFTGRRHGTEPVARIGEEPGSGVGAPLPGVFLC